MVGKEYVLSSAADVLAASRFAGYRVRNSSDCEATEAAADDPGCTVYSSHAQTPWLVGDFEIGSQQSSRNVESAKVVKASAQLDFFLCSSADCTTIADLQVVRLSNGQTRIGVGFSLIPGTLVGVPSGILDPNNLTRATKSRDDWKRRLPPSQAEVAQITQVVYNDSSRAWICQTPDVMNFGVFARVFRESGWEAFRMGTYNARNLDSCVTIISPVHPWMDSHGWNTSHGCNESGGVYLFNSYFPQAFLNRTNGPEDIVEKVFERDDDWSPVFRPTGPLLNAPSDLTYSEAKTYSYLDYSRSLNCQTVDKNEVTGVGCFETRQFWANHYFDDSYFTVLHVGTAAIVAINLTQQGDIEVLRDSHSDSLCYRSTAMVNTGRQDPSLAKPNLFTNTQFKDAQDTIMTVPPWCGGMSHWLGPAAPGDPQQSGRAKQPDDAIRGTILDCAMWDSLGIGYVDKDVDGRNLGAIESTSLSEHLTPRWVAPGAGVGFLGWERPTQQALETAIPNIVLNAAGRLWSQTALVLASTDPTLTRTGAVAMLMTTIVSTIAIAVGCKDMEATIHGFCFRGKIALVQMGLSRLLVCALTFGGVMVSPLMVALSETTARQQNESGQSRKVVWLQVPCLGMGDYRLQGVMSSTFTTVYDDLGQILMWVNFAISALATLLICYKVLSRELPKKPEKELEE